MFNHFEKLEPQHSFDTVTILINKYSASCTILLKITSSKSVWKTCRDLRALHSSFKPWRSLFFFPPLCSQSLPEPTVHAHKNYQLPRKQTIAFKQVEMRQSAWPIPVALHYFFVQTLRLIECESVWSQGECCLFIYFTLGATHILSSCYKRLWDKL